MRKSPSLTSKPALLSGGNPQIAKADGDGPVQAYISAMPGWKRHIGQRLDLLFRGTSLQPIPPGGTADEARWIDIHEGDLDEALVAKWIKQAAAIPGWGKS